jgi:8-oxo-dGTP diphosphatase
MQLVTAALLERDGKILLARRKAGKHMGNRWEFPGGKLLPGETPEQCLRRELQEELGIETRIGEYLGSARFAQGRVELEILLYRAEHLSGAFTLREHEALAWVEPRDLELYDLADSDRELVQRVVRRGA